MLTNRIFASVTNRVEDELVELRKLPRKFEDLKRYKKEILEDLTKRVNDHEDRITTLEASHDELRANNDKDHQQMVLNIHDNQVQCLRGKYYMVSVSSVKKNRTD